VSIRAVDIAGHRIGAGEPCFVIAEAGVNHNGDLGLARRLVEAAHAAGANAVKFQTFRAARLASSTATMAEYQKRNLAHEEAQLAMLQRLELSEEAHRDLVACCHATHLTFLSTAFDEESVDLLERLEVPAFKTASGDLTNLPLLAHLASKGKPLIVSSGMATLAEVESARDTITAHGDPPLVLLHCVSDYPAAASDVNLRAMGTMSAAFGVPVGFSDHTSGIDVAVAAVALGACVVEKHLTLDRSLPGPDHRASLEPAEFRLLVEAVRRVEAGLGDGIKRPTAAELRMAPLARRSLHWRHELEPGAEVQLADLVALRPETGLAPGRAWSLCGRRLVRAVRLGQPVMPEDFGLLP